MENTEIDFTQEPRNVFVNMLIWNLKGIEESLYSVINFDANSVARKIIGLIDTLDAGSQKTLEPQRKHLEEMTRGTKPRNFNDLADLYRTVSSYLHKTYLAEAFRARPMNRNPRHIGSGQTGSE